MGGQYIRVDASSNPHISAVTLNTLSGVRQTENLQRAYDRYWSAGVFYGADYTDNGNGTIGISQGEGVLRESASTNSVLRSVAIPGNSAITLANNDVNYVYADYNLGSPIYTATTNLGDFNCQDKCLVYTIFRDGNKLDVIDGRGMNEDHNTKHRRKLLNTQLFEYSLNEVSFSAYSSSLDIKVTSGYTWYGLNKIFLNEIDTTQGDTFTSYYKDGSGGFIAVTGDTFNSLYYDGGDGSLNDLTNSYYTVRWFYQVINENGGELAMLYSNVNVFSSKLATYFLTPEIDDVPIRLRKLGKLIGRVIVLQGATTIFFVENLVNTSAVQTPDIDHNFLINIQGGQTSLPGVPSQYYHLTENEHSYLQGVTNGLVYSSTTFNQGVTASTNLHVGTRASFDTPFSASMTGGNYTIDLSNGSIQKFYVEDSTTVTYLNALPGTYLFLFENDGSGTQTVSLSGGSGWYTSGGHQPPYSNSANSLNMWTGVYDGDKMWITSTRSFQEV